MTETKKAPPVFKTKKTNGVETAVWKQDSKNGEFYTINTTRSYKKNDEWKVTTSMRASDINTQIEQLQEAKQHLMKLGVEITKTVVEKPTEKTEPEKQEEKPAEKPAE